MYIAPKEGKNYPLGATINPGGVNFCIHSKNATGVELLLFDDADAPGPSRVIPLDPRLNRTFYYWHAFVPGIKAGQLYGYRLYGPHDPTRGQRFDEQKVLLDPYGKGVLVGKSYDRKQASRPGNNADCCMKSVVIDLRSYNWEGDHPLKRPFTNTIIYEMHVGGFTRHESSGLDSRIRGTYAGLIEKIPYLKDLGITAVELLPVYQFDEQDAPNGLANYWGYSPVSFFAPHSGYCDCDDPTGPVNRFCDMVKALHRAGIEVILDVVYNHTAEGGKDGPTLCFRGMENKTYYLLDEDHPSQYLNYSGCGNTLNTNNSIVRRMILDSLHYWVQVMHVDGFRFDLASILSRDEQGKPLKNPPILWEIESDPILAGTKLIAEAWDAGGLYQVGTFIGDRWQEWNGQFRDDVRRFWRGDTGMVTRLALRLLASPDMYGHEEREPEQSINFVTCHDGFTLNDLVSYERKHNLANREGNRDGSDVNFSWNCGVEGPSDDPEVERMRKRQIKNLLATTLLSLGVPMLLMGDEVRRTQGGNNNVFCQDNETSWFDWRGVEQHAEIHRFVKELIHLRRALDFSHGREDEEIPLNRLLQTAPVQWHGVRLYQPDWADYSHSLAFTARSQTGHFLFHTILNAFWKPLTFELLPVPDERRFAWRRVIDTGLDFPQDITPFSQAEVVERASYRVQPRSLIVLAARWEVGS